MPALVTVTVVLLLFCVIAQEASAQFTPELVVVGRDVGSNAITLLCRVRMPDGSIAPLQGAKFYVNETTRDLVTLLSVRSIAYSEEEGRIEFSLPQELEANYFCGRNSTYVSTTPVPLLYYPRRDPIQRYYARSTGDSVAITCGVRQGALANSYTVTWRKGFQLVDTSDPRFSLLRETCEDFSLTISELQVSDSANYTCEVAVQFSNPYFVPDAPAKLLVYAEPTITIHPADVTSLAEDSTVSFTCEATGSPSPTIQWYHNQSPIAQSRGNTVSSKYAINSTSLDGGDTIHSTFTIMNSLSLADSGEVTCEVRVQYQDDLQETQSPTTSATALLTVLDDSFNLQTIVTQGHDLLPQLTLSSRLPSLTTLVLRYSPTNDLVPVDQSSTSAYFNVSRIYHFVPNSFIPPGMTTFRLQVALRVDGKTGPFNPRDVSQAGVIDINVPNDDEECDGISDRTIITIISCVVGGVMLLGVLVMVCVCCAMRGWGRVRKQLYSTKYRKQLSDQRNRLMAGNLSKEEKDKRVDRLDQMICETDQIISRVTTDNGVEDETDLNASGGIVRVISKSSSTEVEGDGKRVVMVNIMPSYNSSPPSASSIDCTTGDGIYEVPDTKTTPPPPLRIEQNVAYGVSSQQSLHMTTNTVYDTCS